MFVLSISLIVAFGIGEIALRLFDIKYPPPVDPNSESLAYRIDDIHRGWAPRANAQTVWNGEGERSEIKMNSAGYRDTERQREKSDNTYRIAFIGDSFVEAIHVGIAKTSASIMQNALAKCPALLNKQVEVINFGVQGYGTAQSLMTLRYHVWPFSPDMVVLGFYPGNDVRNNSRALEHDHLRPYFEFVDGSLQADMSFRQLSAAQRDYYAFSFIDYLPFPLAVVLPRAC